jgi:hypothetical protein
MDLSKLSVKPVVKPHERVPIYIDQAEIKGIEIKDLRNDATVASIDMASLRKNLVKNKLSKISIKIMDPNANTPEKTLESDKPVVAEIKEKQVKPKKVNKKLVMFEEGKENENATEEVAVKPTTQQRKTPKLERGVSELGPEEWVEIGDLSRLPKRTPQINIKVSNYYMNNRKIFVNFINSLFDPYKKEMEDSKKAISCDTIGQQDSESTSLLTHQKIVRDYLNLYTPYRGLLLYFGLGTGKTASSIAIAEGMKSGKKIIVMTPASLRRNYMEELKKFGDAMYKKNQYWEWIDKPEAFETLSAILSLPIEYVKRKQGAWLVNVKKKTNYAELGAPEKKSLDDQLDEMIQSKYTFINYNGLRASRLQDMTNNYEKNLFDNAVVIIDEAHNFISKIVNKLRREKDIKENDRGEKDHLPSALSLKLYEYLLSARNARVVLLTGTPIINYPNELAILFNILRGYIKTWEIPLDIKTSKKITSESLQQALQGEKVLDYLDYSASSKKLFITRNPLGFRNKTKGKSDYAGVSTEKKAPPGIGIETEEDFISDDSFERHVISLLRKMEIDVNTAGIKIHNYKALPDKFDDFITRFIESDAKSVKNIDSFKRRILGLTSYFRSAQEELLPKYEKNPTYHHVIKVPMSDYQFKVYENARKEERKQEKSSKKKQGDFDKEGVFKEPSSTYRIFSRAFCNFVMPVPPGRPMPREMAQTKDNVEISALDELDAVLKKKQESREDVNVGEEGGESESEDILNAAGDDGYQTRLNNALAFIKEHSDEYLSHDGLATYSPKFLHMLENIQDAEHKGLHLVYSQFRTLEGIGLFAMTLEQNGFARFKLKKSTTSADNWEMDMADEDQGKPTYALYTGTETAEEKEIIRNIYNGAWDYVPTNLANKLREIANNNNMGEIIKVLMITSSGSEGINLRNTRYVHIMESYWHPVRTEQVIGRARRICSHKDLPLAMQTVEVFIYLMTFTEKQIKSDDSIELKQKDLSKRDPKIPLTSDEALYEISSIKEDLASQLTKAVKETSIDCAIYSKASKEGLQCVSFGEPKSDAFAYNPSIDQDQVDTITAINKKKIEWKAKSIKIYGVQYAAREMKKGLYNIYDLDSYKRVEETGQGDPILVGTLEIKEDGKKVFNTLVA